MEYRDYSNIVLNKFEKSIVSTNEEFRKKLLLSMIVWFEKKYKSKIENAINNGQLYKLILVSHDIKNICKCKDEDKLKIIQEDEKFEKLKKLSREIYDFAINYAVNKNAELSDMKYVEYLDTISELKSNIAPIFKQEIDKIVSEMMLDLKYLKEKGNIEIYSIRLGNYLKKYNVQ